MQGDSITHCKHDIQLHTECFIERLASVKCKILIVALLWGVIRHRSKKCKALQLGLHCGGLGHQWDSLVSLSTDHPNSSLERHVPMSTSIPGRGSGTGVVALHPLPCAATSNASPLGLNQCSKGNKRRCCQGWTSVDGNGTEVPELTTPWRPHPGWRRQAGFRLVPGDNHQPPSAQRTRNSAT